MIFYFSDTKCSWVYDEIWYCNVLYIAHETFLCVGDCQYDHSTDLLCPFATLITLCRHRMDGSMEVDETY
jgi:hypothetical protein